MSVHDDYSKQKYETVQVTVPNTSGNYDLSPWYYGAGQALETFPKYVQAVYDAQSAAKLLQGILPEELLNRITEVSSILPSISGFTESSEEIQRNTIAHFVNCDEDEYTEFLLKYG